MKYNSRGANKRQRCMKCDTLVNMTVDRIVKGKRYVICMSCYEKEENAPQQGQLFESSSMGKESDSPQEKGRSEGR